MISIYKENLSNHKITYQKLTKKYNIISILRLFVAIFGVIMFYFCFNEPNFTYILTTFLVIILFLVLVVWHNKMAFAREIEKTKIQINQNEIDFLEKERYFSANGLEFQQENHSYAYDLDIFGEKSLYHYINRAVTFSGKKHLAHRFLHYKIDEIKSTQQSILELSEKLNWRQHFTALNSQITDSADFYDKIKDWSAQKDKNLSVFWIYFSKITPILFFLCLILGYLFDFVAFRTWATFIFILNLVVFGLLFGKILRNKSNFEGIYKILNAFKRSIAWIENESFESEKLKEIQQKLFKNGTSASKNIKKLSNLLDNLDNSMNIFAILLNGTTLYHFHIYQNLLKWKKNHAYQVKNWLEVVGEIEALSSFANFKHNHQDFVFPELNTNYKIDFTDLGHPLIAENQRVVNSISFSEHRFVILTGSNMSGKSTFLRTLGVAMLMGAMGLPVCAKRANIHPMRILVSMRLSDSLNDGKSYFFAEIHRIQTIIQVLENERCFVLLDELLRGTNSHDKQLGTIKIIEKMVKLNAIGIVATHDVEVCQLAQQHTQVIDNKYFEASIENESLYFDYKIRNGVCQNKNATFLMKKLGIID